MDLAAEPHHDDSVRYLDDQSPDLGGRVGVRLRVPAAVGAEAVHVRAVVDGEPKYTKATTLEREPGDHGAIWWQADVTIRNPVTTYRFLVETPEGVRWVNGAGTWRRDVGDRDDFVLSTSPCETVHETVLVHASRASHHPLRIGRGDLGMTGGAAESLYGDDQLEVGAAAVSLPGAGPALNVWRISAG